MARAIRTWVVVALAAGVALTHAQARAVPVFARRYGTSCQTCHVVFTKLTPFGAAFRRNGHRFPDRADEDYRRAEPIALGAAAYRDVFPDAVWPGELSSEVPLSGVLGSSATFSPSADAEVDFSAVGGSATLTAATPLGEVFSAWVGLSLRGSTGATATASIERAFVSVTPFDHPYAMLRVGRFEPDLFSFSNHRTLGLVPWILTTTVRDNAFALEPVQLGVEASGVLVGGRGLYAAGLVEGAGNRVNTPKDFYARLGYKLGGMRLDGESPGGEVDLATPAPWREWSVQLDVFGYRGNASIGDPASAAQGDSFFVVGADINAQLRDANAFVACSLGRNDQPDLAQPGAAVDQRQCMAQLDWVVFPWLVPTVRYELREVGDTTDSRIAPGVYALLRANVRTQVLASIAREEGRSFELEQVMAGISVGF